MFQRASALMLLVLSARLALADEFSAVITKVEAGKVVLHKVENGRKAAEAAAWPVADNVVVARAMFDRNTKKFSPGAPLEDGLKNAMFTRIGERGVGARIVTDADNTRVTHILVTEGRKQDQK
jgi:hypothetical protein